MVRTCIDPPKEKQLSNTSTQTAILVSNNGLGDNLFCASAVRFLLNYYNQVRFLCKDIYLDNVQLFFHKDENVVCVPFPHKNEAKMVNQIIIDSYAQCDVYVCGAHMRYLVSDIKHPKVLEYQNNSRNDKNYDVIYDTINYRFLQAFYDDIKLDLSVYYENFRIDSTEESLRLHQLVNPYRIIFTQIVCSHGQKLNIEALKQKYLNDDFAIIITTSENLYDKETQPEKHAICENFVFNKLVNYIDVILNADEIYLLESCFTAMVLPLLKCGMLKADPVRIIDRATSDNYAF